MELLAALIGALTATIISLTWAHLSEKAKRRADILLEEVAYCDKVYKLLQDIHAHKYLEYTEGKVHLPKREYDAKRRELTTLLATHNEIVVKLAITYHDDLMIRAFVVLRDSFLEVSDILQGSTRAAWPVEHREIKKLMEKEIDPFRNELIVALVESTRTVTIFKEDLKRWDNAIYGFISKSINKIQGIDWRKEKAKK